MPLKLYVGKPREGKTYQVASYVIFNALASGRRVVSNIAGLDIERYKALLIEKGIAPDKIGTIVQVSHDDVLKPHFFPTDHDQQDGVQAFVEAGDLVALDEIWRFWKERGQIPDEHMNFFRTHGHHVNPDTGFIIEIALITQVVGDLNEKIRGIVDETYLMRKLNKLGMSGHYTVDIFDRASIAKSKHIRQLPPTKYDSKYFGLYKSHSQNTSTTQAVEKNIDGRGNILKGKIFMVLFLLLILSAFSIYYIYGFFHGRANPKTQTEEPQTATHSATGAATPANLPTVTDWVIVGLYSLNKRPVLLLKNASGAYRHVFDFDALKVQGLDISAEIDGQKYNNWLRFESSNTSLVNNNAPAPSASN